MSHRILPLALSVSLLSACSTMQPPAHGVIPPPPVALISRCLTPGELPGEATAQALVEWTVAWVGTAGCERAKRQALIEAWPR